jgi:hypothetical protein
MTPAAIKESTHLGDGLHALWDGQDIALFTYDGPLVLDVVYLDYEVRRGLIDFMRNILSGETKPVKFE